VITAKYADHTPLYRQSQIFAREGVELERSVLARWVGEGAALLTPLAEVLRRYVLNTEKLHGDDTPIPVLAPGKRQDQDRPVLDLCSRQPGKQGFEEPIERMGMSLGM